MKVKSTVVNSNQPGRFVTTTLLARSSAQLFWLVSRKFEGVWIHFCSNSWTAKRKVESMKLQISKRNWIWFLKSLTPTLTGQRMLEKARSESSSSSTTKIKLEICWLKWIQPTTMTKSYFLKQEIKVLNKPLWTASTYYRRCSSSCLRSLIRSCS